MALLNPMPGIHIDREEMVQFGRTWAENNGSLSRTPPYSSGQLGRLFDQAVGESLAIMLGGIPIENPSANSLIPTLPDCVEVGPVRIIGGVRPQNFDVGYRPDGVRFAFDSKTLNDQASIGKNWQNMVNDLATEATTVHSRFPHALVAFMVIVPLPALQPTQERAMIETLERLTGRLESSGPVYMAEAISMVAWNPEDGTLSSDVPASDSMLRIERFSEQIHNIYVLRYKGLPPHSSD